MISTNLAQLLVGAAILGLIGVWTAVVTTTDQPVASIALEPNKAVSVIDKPFSVQVVVESSTNANAYSGLIEFNNEVLEVASIDYNTSIADLWVTKPWYENGDGTINFAGGTTKPGGFIGKDTLLTITFVPINIGQAEVKIVNAMVLAHDGFGSELKLAPTIDALFTDISLETQSKNLSLGSDRKEEDKNSLVTILEETPNYDLNDDGKIGLADISIFMSKFLGHNSQFDFNQDGKVNTTDLSLLLNARTD
ncbi:MAG: hypothetical protein H6779_03835 [Candidatus Nomurabacteria bacterium]|nr:MAG: hypothetical protein H6779_03835 [Candidatus Nomurabacteria bacterium]